MTPVCNATLVVRNLKVKNPEKYGWDPKWLLSHLIHSYLHLDSDALVTAIANDQVTNMPTKESQHIISAILQTGNLPRHCCQNGEDSE